MTKEVTKENIDSKIKIVEGGINKLLESENLDLTFIIDFPKYRELPDEVTLALKILDNHGAIVVKKYTPKDKPTQPKE